VSATEVIQEIKNLPREEQQVVFAFIDDLKRRAGAAPADARYIDDATFESAKRQVLAENRELLRRLAR
jgi:hypothetical protein